MYSRQGEGGRVWGRSKVVRCFVILFDCQTKTKTKTNRKILKPLFEISSKICGSVCVDRSICMCVSVNGEQKNLLDLPTFFL